MNRHALFFIIASIFWTAFLRTRISRRLVFAKSNNVCQIEWFGRQEPFQKRRTIHYVHFYVQAICYGQIDKNLSKRDLILRVPALPQFCVLLCT